MNFKENIKELIVYVIDKFGGSISSKTKIHKLFYFFSIVLTQDLKYKPHFYGPYSPFIEDALGELCASNFLDVKTERYGYDSKGFERLKYTYILNEDGKVLLDIFKQENKEEDFSNLDDLINKFKEELSDPDYMDLSVAAKSYFILDYHKQPLNCENIREKANELNWEITEKQVAKGVEILQKLKLVSCN